MVKEQGVSLQVGFNRRFDPNFRKVYDFIQQGEVGQPHILKLRHAIHNRQV